MITCATVGLSHQKFRLIKNSRLHKDIFLLGVDVKKDVIINKIADAFEVIPFAREKNYITIIKKIIKKYQVNLIIPCSDEEALILAKNRNYIENLNTKIFVDDYDLLKKLSSKVKTYKLLKGFNKYIPKHYLCKNFKDVDLSVKKVLDKNNFFVIKPDEVSRGGRNVCVIENTKKNYKKFFNDNREIHASLLIFNNEIKKTYEKLFPLIIMEKLLLPAYDLDILAKNGKLLQCVSRHRVDPFGKNGHIVFEDQKFYNFAKKLCKSLNLNGIYDCDLMRDKKNQLKILEINPRQSGSIAVAMSAGVKLYDQIFSFARNKKIKIFKKIKKVKILPTVVLEKM